MLEILKQKDFIEWGSKLKRVAIFLFWLAMLFTIALTIQFFLELAKLDNSSLEVRPEFFVASTFSLASFAIIGFTFAAWTAHSKPLNGDLVDTVYYSTAIVGICFFFIAEEQERREAAFQAEIHKIHEKISPLNDDLSGLEKKLGTAKEEENAANKDLASMRQQTKTPEFTELQEREQQNYGLLYEKLDLGSVVAALISLDQYCEDIMPDLLLDNMRINGRGAYLLYPIQGIADAAIVRPMPDPNSPFTLDKGPVAPLTLEFEQMRIATEIDSCQFTMAKANRMKTLSTGYEKLVFLLNLNLREGPTYAAFESSSDDQKDLIKQISNHVALIVQIENTETKLGILSNSIADIKSMIEEKAAQISSLNDEKVQVQQNVAGNVKDDKNVVVSNLAKNWWPYLLTAMLLLKLGRKPILPWMNPKGT